jgi:hypothetical protein
MAGLAALFGQNPQSLKSLYVDDPRSQLAQTALQQGTNMAPAQGGWGEALARAFQGGMGGYMQGEIMKDAKRREADKAATLATALSVGKDLPAESKTYSDGTVIDWQARDGNQAMINALGSNPDTAPIGMSVQAQMMDNERAQSAELAKMRLAGELKAAEPITPYQEAQLGIDRDKLELDRMKVESGSNGISYTMPDGTVVQVGGSEPYTQTPYAGAPDPLRGVQDKRQRDIQRGALGREAEKKIDAHAEEISKAVSERSEERRVGKECPM